MWPPLIALSRYPRLVLSDAGAFEASPGYRAGGRSSPRSSGGLQRTSGPSEGETPGPPVAWARPASDLAQCCLRACLPAEIGPTSVRLERRVEGCPLERELLAGGVRRLDYGRREPVWVEPSVDDAERGVGPRRTRVSVAEHERTAPVRAPVSRQCRRMNAFLCAPMRPRWGHGNQVIYRTTMR